jgi:hypothetical protein
MFQFRPKRQLENIHISVKQFYTLLNFLDKIQAVKKITAVNITSALSLLLRKSFMKSQLW